MPFLRGTLLSPKLQQRECGKPAGNFASAFGSLRGPLVLVGFSFTDRRSRAERFGQAPNGHLRARCLSWLTPGVVSISFDAADCLAGHQGGAAGLRKIPGAGF
eukprot:1146158-Pelagomonas_calceolata.AAC.3